MRMQSALRRVEAAGTCSGACLCILPRGVFRVSLGESRLSRSVAIAVRVRRIGQWDACTGGRGRRAGCGRGRASKGGERTGADAATQPHNDGLPRWLDRDGGRTDCRRAAERLGQLQRPRGCGVRVSVRVLCCPWRESAGRDHPRQRCASGLLSASIGVFVCACSVCLSLAYRGARRCTAGVERCVDHSTADDPTPAVSAPLPRRSDAQRGGRRAATPRATEEERRRSSRPLAASSNGACIATTAAWRQSAVTDWRPTGAQRSSVARAAAERRGTSHDSRRTASGCCFLSACSAVWTRPVVCACLSPLAGAVSWIARVLENWWSRLRCAVLRAVPSAAVSCACLSAGVCCCVGSTCSPLGGRAATASAERGTLSG